MRHTGIPKRSESTSCTRSGCGVTLGTKPAPSSAAPIARAAALAPPCQNKNKHARGESMHGWKGGCCEGLATACVCEARSAKHAYVRVGRCVALGVAFRAFARKLNHAKKVPSRRTPLCSASQSTTSAISARLTTAPHSDVVPIRKPQTSSTGTQLARGSDGRNSGVAVARACVAAPPAIAHSHAAFLPWRRATESQSGTPHSAPPALRSSHRGKAGVRTSRAEEAGMRARRHGQQ